MRGYHQRGSLFEPPLEHNCNVTQRFYQLILIGVEPNLYLPITKISARPKVPIPHLAKPKHSFTNKLTISGTLGFQLLLLNSSTVHLSSEEAVRHAIPRAIRIPAFPLCSALRSYDRALRSNCRASVRRSVIVGCGSLPFFAASIRCDSVRLSLLPTLPPHTHP
jgi:hypothetical protein